MAQAGTFFSEGEKNAVSFFSFNFSVLFACLPAASRAHRSSLPYTDPQILEHWGYADEDHLGKSFQAMDFGLKCQRDVRRLLWISHVGSVSACLSSSAKSMKTSAAPCPEIRKTTVVYLMSKRPKQVSLFFDAAHSFSSWPLHFCHHSFCTFC